MRADRTAIEACFDDTTTRTLREHHQNLGSVGEVCTCGAVVPWREHLAHVGCMIGLTRGLKEIKKSLDV